MLEPKKKSLSKLEADAKVMPCKLQVEKLGPKNSEDGRLLVTEKYITSHGLIGITNLVELVGDEVNTIFLVRWKVCGHN